MSMNNPYLEDDATASVEVVDHTAIDMPDDILLEQELELQQAELEQQREEQERAKIMQMHERFRRSQVARAHKEEQWNQIDEFDRGEQWKNLNIPPWIPKPVTNYIRYYRTLKRANLASGVSRPTFEPLDPMDQPIVDRLQLAHDHVWDTENVPRKIRKCIDRALNNGTSVMMVYTDESFVGGKYYPEKPVLDPTTQQPMMGPDGQPITTPDERTRLYQGKIEVDRIPIENFFPDPDAYRLKDCKFIETTEIVPFSNIRNNKMFREFTGDKVLSIQAPRPDTDGSSSGEIFNRDHEVTASIAGEPGDEIVTLHTHYERYINEAGKWQLDVTYYLRDPDIILYHESNVQPNEYPFAVYYDEEEEKDFWGTSQAMTGLLEAQKTINKVQQVSSTIGALHQNPQKVVLRESGINAQKLAQTSNLPGQVHMSNVPKPIEVIQPPDIPRGLFELDDRTKMDAKDIMGVNEAYMGNSVGSLTTSTGVDSLIERATIRDRDKMVQIDEFVERISHLIVLNIIHKWQEERPIPQPGPDGSVQFTQWQPLDEITANNLEWRVKSNVYVKSPITQTTRRQQADKIMQMQGQFQYQPALITPEEYMKFQEFDDGPKMIARMQADRMRMQQQQQMMASGLIQQQLVMLAQMMAARQLPPEQLQQMVDQLVQVASQPAMAMGQPPGAESQQQPTAPGQPSLPSGTFNEAAMANMNTGSM